MSTPDKLNERPIYLRYVFLLMAVAQSFAHLWDDFSIVTIPVSRVPAPSDTDYRTHRIESLPNQLQSALIPILRRTLIVSCGTSLAAPFFYTLLFRRKFWSCHLFFAKLIFNLSRSNARPVGYPPSSFGLMYRSFTSGFLLVLTWQATSFLFTALLAQEPLKKDQPLSAGSRDPNGTLLNGLKTKKYIVKSYAFWELDTIAQRFPERRKAIFTDIEREGGSCWGQMQDLALNVVREIDSRIVATAPEPPNGSVTIQTLPQLTASLSSEPIIVAATPPRSLGEKVASDTGSILKALGQSDQPWNPALSKSKALIEYLQSTGVIETFMIWVSQLQASPVGWGFRPSKQGQINAVVLGTPYANAAMAVDAVDSVTRMLVASLSEDVYGQAISGVPEAVRTFANAISAMEAFLQQNAKGVNAGIEEVETVLERLKAGLTELLSAFQLYLSDVGLGAAELREARRLAEKKTVPATKGNVKMIGEKEKGRLGEDMNGGPVKMKRGKPTERKEMEMVG